MDLLPLAEGFAAAFVPILVIVDPLASIGLFLGLTADKTRRERDRVALRAVTFAAAVLVVFAIAGRAILGYLGIELYSLRVAGGLLLVLIGLNMLKEGEEVPAQELARSENLEVATGGTHRTGRVAHDPSFVPLGLPMLAGPGAISLVIVQGISAASLGGALVVGGAIAAAMAVTLAVLWITARASHVIGENGRRVITRIMGLLTVAFAVQYVLDGIRGWLNHG